MASILILEVAVNNTNIQYNFLTLLALVTIITKKTVIIVIIII